MISSTSDSDVQAQETGAGAGLRLGNVVTSDAVSNADNATDRAPPPLSPGDYTVYNRLAERMDYFVCAHPFLHSIPRYQIEVQSLSLGVEYARHSLYL
ncbi:hypothetical protein GE21DRAFT_1092562 [Neurospora crassa]|nr:hypothetical protein GE21DRAFT_1092562 [Neurospora crassa]